MSARRLAAYSFESSFATGTFANAGSAMYLLRSANASFVASMSV